MSENAPAGPVAGHTWNTTPRCDPPKQPAPERVTNFRDVYEPYDEQVVREQAARCIQCPDPLCVAGCPLRSPIPDWLTLVADGRFADAVELIEGAAGMPEIEVCSFVPPHVVPQFRDHEAVVREILGASFIEEQALNPVDPPAPLDSLDD